MTLTEKIANAEARMKELQLLVSDWTKQKEKNIKKVDFQVCNEKLAA